MSSLLIEMGSFWPSCPQTTIFPDHSQIAGNTEVNHCPWLDNSIYIYNILFLLFFVLFVCEMRSCYITQASLELLDSSHSPASVIRIIDMCHCTWSLSHFFENLSLVCLISFLVTTTAIFSHVLFYNQETF
jgi:hypothetical protein